MNNRVYKFRAWDYKTKAMYTQNVSIHTFRFGKDMPWELESLSGVVCDYTDGQLMQFTGMFDKNGVEVYEGDIVKESFFISRFIEESPFEIKDGKSIIKETKVKSYKLNDPIFEGKWKTEPQDRIFEVKSLRQIFEYLKDWEKHFEQKDLEKWKKGNCLEVIGNIMENPELLGEK